MSAYYNEYADIRGLEDCVCQAISTATGLKYNAVSNLLTISAKGYQCERLCVCCYHHLLEDILGYEVYMCRQGERVKDIISRYDDNVVIVRINGHLTCGRYGALKDTYDCSNRYADCFWIIK